MKSDADLMVDFQQGDREAFEKLVLRHQVGVFNFFYRLLGDRELAEDQTQEVFYRLFLHAETYQQLSKFTTYLYRIARNCWIDHLRKVKRRGRMESLDREDAEGVNLYDRLSAPAEDPGARLEAEQRESRVQAAIGELPEEQRVVLLLSEVQGMKYAEISESLGIPVGTVKSRMHTAVQRLRRVLEKQGVLPEEDQG